jgi:hypothetical protein
MLPKHNNDPIEELCVIEHASCGRRRLRWFEDRSNRQKTLFGNRCIGRALQSKRVVKWSGMIKVGVELMADGRPVTDGMKER